MKTTLYIDGYNLYYGLLKNTPSSKWLDLPKLLIPIAKENTPNIEIVDIKLFTAPVKRNFATHGDMSTKSQNDYHRALQIKYPNTFQIILGIFRPSEGWFPKYQKPIDRNDTIRAWKLEEKQTDVNIALHMYRDVAQKKVEQVILVSNDTDLYPALQSIMKDFPKIRVGSIMPILKQEGSITRPASKDIQKYSHWTRRYINKQEILNSQLPDKIPTKKKPIYKPTYW